MRYVAFDVETPNYANDRMSAIGVVVIEDDRIIERYYSLVQPETHFDPFNIALTGITPEAVATAPTFAQLWPQLRRLFEQGVLLAHNAPFDMAVLSKCLRYYQIDWRAETQYLCTCRLAKRCLPLPDHKLDTLCRHYGLDLDHHQADSDAMACAEIFLRLHRQTDLSALIRTYDLRSSRTIQNGTMKTRKREECRK